MPPTPPPTIKRSISEEPVIDLTYSDDDNGGIDLINSDDGNDNNNVDLTNSNDDDNDLDGIRYPGIPAMLAELEREFPTLGFTQYEEILIRNGFAYVSQLIEEDLDVRQQLGDLGIRMGEINLLLSRAKRIVRRTQKLKEED